MAETPSLHGTREMPFGQAVYFMRVGFENPNKPDRLDRLDQLSALAGGALRGSTCSASTEGRVSEEVHARDETRAIRRAVGRWSSVHW